MEHRLTKQLIPNRDIQHGNRPFSHRIWMNHEGMHLHQAYINQMFIFSTFSVNPPVAHSSTTLGPISQLLINPPTNTSLGCEAKTRPPRRKTTQSQRTWRNSTQATPKLRIELWSLVLLDRDSTGRATLPMIFPLSNL